MITELEAVNRMLSSIGQVPVTFIPDGGQSDSRIAAEILKDYTVELQQEGYDFNTDEGVELTPDPSGDVYLNVDVLRVIPNQRPNRYTIREGKLYDLDAKSSVFNKPVVIDVIVRRSFEDLPYALQNYVTIRAARVFANRVIGAPEQNGFNSEDEARARISWLNVVAEDMKLNLLSNSTHHAPNATRPYQALIRGF